MPHSISYSKADNLLRQHVWIKELATGQEHQIGGGDFLSSNGAKWTPDGKKLLFLGGVGSQSVASTARSTSQLYAVSLVPVEKDPNSADIDTEAQAEAADTAATGRGNLRGRSRNIRRTKRRKCARWDAWCRMRDTCTRGMLPERFTPRLKFLRVASCSVRDIFRKGSPWRSLQREAL